MFFRGKLNGMGWRCIGRGERYGCEAGELVEWDGCRGERTGVMGADKPDWGFLFWVGGLANQGVGLR